MAEKKPPKPREPSKEELEEWSKKWHDGFVRRASRRSRIGI
jgi:hypothetical protein